ncbi:MAG: NAD-dependent epimerase/dehydratase family protein [Polyangiaceae bacterium]
MAQAKEKSKNPGERRRTQRREGGRRKGDAQEPTRRAVVITGICGRLGRRLARALHRERPVIGLDRRPFEDRPKDIEHLQVDIRRKKAREVFRRAEIGAVVHLGVMHDPRGGSQVHHAWNVVAFQKLLDWVQAYRIPKLVLLSSANVYGPRPDNPQFLSEEAPLLGADRFSDMRDLVELDMLAQSFFWKHPDTETVILRPTNILGNVRNAASNYLRLPRVPTLLGFDPMVQVVHQEDVVSALRLSLQPGVRGIFNIAGPMPVALSRVLGTLGRPTVRVPHQLARLGLERLFNLHITSFPAPELDFIRYVCMVDDRRARETLGYEPTYDLQQTISAVDEERWI